MATSFKWHNVISRHHMLRNIILLGLSLTLYFVIEFIIPKGGNLIPLLHKADLIFMVTVFLLMCNSLLLSFLDIYSHTDRHKSHPLQGLIQGLQVMLFFIGGIVIVSVIIDKSPKVLLTGLGASAAVLMLIFKDSILGFVAGVQLSQNRMVEIGDWIQMPDGSANGIVEEITLNTVKVRNWDNTITMIPPYTLVSTPFKNWRGMQESGGRRVDKKIFLDISTLETFTEDMLADMRKHIPLMKDWQAEKGVTYSNSRLYRIYIERYLRQHPIVAGSLDLIIAQREPTGFGLPIEVYFFLSDKVWNEYETIQSDIFDHLLSMAPEFGLKLYQLPA